MFEDPSGARVIPDATELLVTASTYTVNSTSSPSLRSITVEPSIPPAILWKNNFSYRSEQVIKPKVSYS